jgi:hypothetical protein
METSVTGASSSTADSMGMTVSGLPNVFFASRSEACKTVNFPLCLPDELFALDAGIDDFDDELVCAFVESGCGE